MLFSIITTFEIRRNFLELLSFVTFNALLIKKLIFNMAYTGGVSL